MEDDADDVDADAQDYAAMLKELGNDDGDWEGETGLGKNSVHIFSRDFYFDFQRATKHSSMTKKLWITMFSSFSKRHSCHLNLVLSHFIMH